MRRLTLTLALLALTPPALGQYPSPQQAAPAVQVPALTVPYLAPRPIYAAPAPPQYFAAAAAPRYSTFAEVPLVPGRPPKPRRGPLVLELSLPGLRLARRPALEPVAVQPVQQAVYEAPALAAAAKAPPLPALAAPQAGGKQAGADEEPEWARRIEKRLGALEDEYYGDKAPAPPAKGE